jgi:hypothetical protein
MIWEWREMNQTSSSKIIVSRATAQVDLLRSYRINIDHKDVEKIKIGKSIEIPVAPGDHTIVVKIDWCGSNKIPFQIKEGETLHFECGSSMTGAKFLFAFFYIIFMPNEYLWIKKA